MGATLTVLSVGTYVEAREFDKPPLEVSFHSSTAQTTEVSQGKLESWEFKVEAGRREQARAEFAKAEHERIIAAEAEREAKEIEENEELATENVRESDTGDDSSGNGAGESASEEETEEGASEVPEEEPEISEESTEEDAEGDGVIEEETPENESVGEDAGPFEMTHYVAYCDTGCTGVTATGYDVSSTIYSPEGLRIVAADPGVLPFGTIIEITSGGNTFQAAVLDSGGDINGNRLDLLVESEAEALEYGRQDVDVRILGQ